MFHRLTIDFESASSPEAQSLIDRLSRELADRYGDDGTGDFSPRDVENPRAGFLVARCNGVAIGCGALRPLSETVVELKRLYVDPSHRRRGISRRILAALEERARQLGYVSVRLETGTCQPEAIALYEATGYHRIPCYGYYANDPRSICFEKFLAQGRGVTVSTTGTAVPSLEARPSGQVMAALPKARC